MENTYGAIEESRCLVLFYNRKNHTFEYHKDLIAYFDNDYRLADKALWDYFSEAGILSAEDADSIRQICLELNDQQNTYTKYFWLFNKGFHALVFVYHGDFVSITLRDLSPFHRQHEGGHRDDLTGLLNRNNFYSEVEAIIDGEPSKQYALCYFDVEKFKAVNDLFGFAEGDNLLIYIAHNLQNLNAIAASCRLSADKFAFLANVTDQPADHIVNILLPEIKRFKASYEINCNVGIYLISDLQENAPHMLDKAMLAQSAIKGKYDRKINYYTNELRDAMLSEQEIVSSMNSALEENQFVVYYQPQYDHSTGMIIGAEALVRWAHPEKGLIPPNAFIPLFERNGFIDRLDHYVFEQVCQFLRHCIDRGYALIPISINFSMGDVYSHNFVEGLENIRKKYDVPSRLLRIELTERILISNSSIINEIFRELHECGYIIELDDFGSGYSSLTTLKNLDVDIVKLDMLFLENADHNSRGGTILSSVINMTKWLKIPVIAEGVETIQQADFLRSIGCNYIQGYLYSQPIPEKEYEALLSAGLIGSIIPQMHVIDTMNFANFWDPKSQETLIFNNFVGGAAIVRYNRTTKHREVLRVNQKFLQELGMNLSEREVIHGDCHSFLSETDKLHYLNTLNNAIDTMEEQECETWRQIHSSCCGDETICLRSNVKVIGSSGDQFLFYEMIRNVTNEKLTYQSMQDTERRFKMASEQVNIYFWEYTVATKEMRPCFRCMRDLGLPPLLRNYPDSAIEAGIFPPEVADMYRDWHVQVANGVESLEAIIPLTMDRVPFHVRYTTEFDENGNPVKAYGSAALVVD